MRWLLGFFGGVTALAAVVWGTYMWLLQPTSTSDRPVLFEVEQGAGLITISNRLERRQLVRSSGAFRLYLRLADSDRDVKAGLYALRPNLGVRGVAAVLVEGRGMGKRLTIPEGWTARQIARLVDEASPGAGAEFEAQVSRPTRYREDFEWLRPLSPEASLEGFLYPDTYVITPGPGAADALLRLMLMRFEQVALPVLKASGPRLGIYQRLILASIIEKEAVNPEERPTISGVFYNRLMKRMPFGSDPTVEYALGRHQGAKGLSLADVAVDSPYNTYKYPGLPPGPIANPGVPSMQAAVSPRKTEMLYFVAKGDGTHEFTQTYEEHLAAQARIVAGRRR